MTLEKKCTIFFECQRECTPPPPKKSQMAYFHFQSAFVGIPGLFSPFGPTNFRPTSDSAPHSEALGTHPVAGVM